MASIDALVEVFPESKIAACLFHLVKNFKKKIADCGLTVRYRDPEYSIRARMILALAFVPPDEALACYNKLRTHLMAYSEDLAPVLTWIKRNYIGTAMRPAMFPIRWWSCYERTLAGEDRTNNFAEAAHRRLQDALGVDHPSVGRLLQDLKRIQRTHDMHYEQYLAGKAAPKKREIYFDADARILAEVHLYDATTLMQI